MTTNITACRAVEAVVWGMPAVNFELMLQAFTQNNGAPNQIAFWPHPLDWHNQTLTPNPDTIYLMPFFDTRNAGPIVLEIPPADNGSITGSIIDGWQVALEDVGPAGADKGTGGKYLLLPPGYAGERPSGYIALPSNTYRGYALLRSNLQSASSADIAAAVGYGKRIKLYPLAQAANPLPTVFIDQADFIFDGTIPYDLRFFEALNRFVQVEPWLSRDRAMIDQLKSAGIEKNKAFAPNAEMQTILRDAARDGHAYLDERLVAILSQPYFAESTWASMGEPELLAAQKAAYEAAEAYPIDIRGVVFSYAFSSIKTLGAAQFYLISLFDRRGDPLHGDASYRLTVPAKVPVTNYWSATAYDRKTHALIRNVAWSSRSSHTPGLHTNADGTVDVYFGPSAPAERESNWIPTSAERPFEVLFRFYGATNALFDKTWSLPNIELCPALLTR